MLTEAQVNSNKRVTLEVENNEVVFVLNHTCKQPYLAVCCRDPKIDKKYWAQFTLNDLDQYYQSLFQKIDNLFDYISQNTQEIQICNRSIKIQLNFLKQSKQIQLNVLSKVRESKDSDEGLSKINIPMKDQALNLQSYKVTNFYDITPLINRPINNLIKICPETQLPEQGQCHFLTFIYEFQSRENIKPYPMIEIGVKNELNERVSVCLNSNLQQFPQRFDEKYESLLDQFDTMRFIYHMNFKELIIEKNFRFLKGLSFKELKGNKFWIYLRIFKLKIKTNLFIKEEDFKWRLYNLDHKE